MNKFKSRRSKRRRIQEQLFAYTSNDVPIISPNVLTVEDESSFNIQVQTISKVLPDVSNTIDHFSHNTSFMEIPRETPNINIRQTSHSNQIPCDTQYVPQNDIKKLDKNQFCDNVSSLCSMLSAWVLNNNITHSALDSLLVILRKHSCFSNIPKDSRTILQTKSIDNTCMRVIDSGKYYHFGLGSGIENNFQHNVTEIKLVIGIDGLPISKSTSSQFWPILAYIRPHDNLVFSVGIFHGNKKPSSCNEFLKDFVMEAKHLTSNSIIINNKSYEITVDVICCDSPAKSFVLNVKEHTGYFSCTRCKIEGEFIENRTCFPYNQSDLQPSSRTHGEYLDKVDKEYQASLDISCLSEIPRFDVVSNFSLDYMHLICLGTVKKLIFLWKKGPYSVRLPSWKVDAISSDAVSLKTSFPCEFSRKPRSLDEFARFKATEFRTYLLYIFPIILKKTLSVNCFKHFMALNIAMIVLLSPDHLSYVNYARNLLKYFVHSFKDLYGSHYISHNIHGLL